MTHFFLFFLWDAIVLGLLTYLPLVVILLLIGGIVLLRIGGAYGAPLLFWHEERRKQAAAGCSVAVLVCEVLFVAYLLDSGNPGRWDWRDALPAGTHPITAAAIYIGTSLLILLLAGLSVAALKRLLKPSARQGTMTATTTTTTTTGAPLARATAKKPLAARTSDELRWGVEDEAHDGGWPFALGFLGGMAGVAIVFALAWVLRDPLRHLMPARVPGWSPLRGKECTDEVVPHVLAGISFAFFLAVYVSAGIRRRGIATPATAICALFGLITALYGVLAFHHAPMTAVVILLALFALVYGGPRWRFRLDCLAGRYRNGPPARLYDYPEAPIPGGNGGLVILSRPPRVSGRPLVIVCASGGGIRAAVWTARMLYRLEQEIPEFPYHTRLIFGASGGMVGAGHYVATLCPPGTRADGRCHDAVTEDEFVEPVERESLSATVYRMIYGDFRRFFQPGQPSTDRGRVIEGVWQRNMGRGMTTTFGELREGEQQGWRPTLVFSPMFVEDGRRLLISNADLAALCYTEGSEIKAPADQPGVPVPVPHQFYSRSALEYRQLFPEAFDRTPLSSAARMSATFPFVTPAVVLPTEPRRRVVDAGYYDNYGVSLAADWLDECLAADPQWLREHFSGVLVVQIRDGVLNLTCRMSELPAEYSGAAGRGIEDLAGPLQGVFAAREAAQLFRNDETMESLGERFRTAGFSDGYFTSVAFEFGGNASLSWYLSTKEKASLAEYTRRPELGTKLQKVRQWWDARPAPPGP
jgi:Patatin-like phospholipase